MVSIRGGFSSQLSKFLFSLADVGNFMLLPAMEDEVVMVTSMKNAKRIVSRYPAAIVLDYSEELEVILAKGYDDWREYRDKVGG